MIYDYIIENYKEAEPIFFSDLKIEGVTKSAVNQQMKNLCDRGELVKYATGIYYRPKKSRLLSDVGPNADTVAKYRFISRGEEVSGFYAGNTFANKLGISVQVPRVVEIVSNNTNSSPREVEIGGRSFFVRKPIVTVTRENVHVLQILDLLKNVDAYLDGTYAEAQKKFYEYIQIHNIKKSDVDKYIRKFPIAVFKYYYELELDRVLA